ncbi:MAG: hypothetical protein IKF71_03690 [Bacilli bacterium]|nr:hypothetical protein [Bacilli bacterium]
MEEKTVSLSLGTIIRECSLNPDLAMEQQFYFMSRNRENIHDVFRYKKFNEDFVGRVDCFNDGNNLIGMIRPSYEEFLRKLMNILHLPIKGKIVDDDQLTQKLLAQVEKLKQVTSEQELEIEFPVLYRDLVDGRKFYHDLQRMRKQEGYDPQDYASGEHYFYSCGLKKSLKNFVQTQGEVYSRFILRRKDLQQKQQQMSFNRYIASHFDMDKFYMYVMHEYLVKAEGCQNRVEMKKYISLVEKYLSSDKKKDVVITTDSGMKVDEQNIQNRLRNLKRIISDDSSQVEWVLIPGGRDYSRVRKDVDVVPPGVKMTLEDYLRLCEKGERKRAFYEGTPYLARVLGLEMYRGYIGYIYDNGEVILDTEYDPFKPATAEGNAVYNLKVGDFELLSQYDKQHLRKHPRVGVMNHSKTWEDRVSKIIDREALPQEIEASKQLIKRLKERNESY